MSESISSMSNTSGFGVASAQRVNASPMAPDPYFVKMSNPDPIQKLVAQCARPRRQRAQDDLQRPFHIFAHGLGTLDIDVHATVAILSVEQVAQSQQGRGLARLPRRVQDEVAFVADEPANLGEVQPFQGRDAVVVFSHHGAGGVEKAHGSSLLPLLQIVYYRILRCGELIDAFMTLRGLPHTHRVGIHRFSSFSNRAYYPGFNLIPIDLSSKPRGLGYVHITVLDFGRVFNQTGKGRGNSPVCARRAATPQLPTSRRSELPPRHGGFPHGSSAQTSRPD